MKLISMTDFIENLRKEMTIKSPLSFNETKKYFDKVFNYSEFLKQTLKLEMFVPCDDEGNVLNKPNGYNNFIEYGYNDFLNEPECKEYKQAKEKVLFGGFEVKRNYIMYYDFMYMMTYELENKNIESIINKIPNNNLTLTQNATKQFLK